MMSVCVIYTINNGFFNVLYMCVSGEYELAAGCRTEMILPSLQHLKTLFSVPSAGFIYGSLFIIKHPAWTFCLPYPAASRRLQYTVFVSVWLDLLLTHESGA